LYHNNGDGTFTDVTDKAGVAGMEFGTYFHSGAVFFDYDRDGKLDLYVGGYVALPPGAKRYCQLGTIQSSCAPSAYEGSPNLLYHNNGDGTFTNVTKKAGVYQPQGKNLAIGAFAYDNDGWPDIFVANDGLSAYLYHNQHDGTFKEEGALTGMAYTGQGLTMAAMCISLGDYDNDGWLDLFISDFQGSSDHIWKNDGHGLFDDVSDLVGITVPTKRVLSFGGGFFDYDNDGWLDLFIANGHVYPEVEQVTPEVHYKQINTLFHNDGHGRFVDVTKTSGSGFDTPYVGRGVAFADFDNDGFVDVLVSNNGDPPLLLHNSGGNGNHFVSFKLIGTKSNRDAIGTRLKVTAGGISQIREVSSGGSYLSQSDLRAHFGLGSAVKIDKLEISWPSGAKQTFADVPSDQFYSIQEGNDKLGFQPFVKAVRAKATAPSDKSCAARPTPRGCNASLNRGRFVLPGVLTCTARFSPGAICMKPWLRAGLLLALVALASLPLLGSTRIVHRWVLTGIPMPQFHKMLVASIAENYLVRQQFEDEMKKLLAKYEIEGVQSYMVLPPKNEMMEGELKQRIKESSLDSVLVVRPKAVRKETEEVSRGIYVPPPGYYTFWPYWNMAYGEFYPTSSYTKENIVVRMEFNLYEIKDERLIWSGESDTIYSTDFERLGKEYAKALVNQLKKDKVIRKT
jgi:hypothetical protein